MVTTQSVGTIEKLNHVASEVQQYRSRTGMSSLWEQTCLRKRSGRHSREYWTLPVGRCSFQGNAFDLGGLQAVLEDLLGVFAALLRPNQSDKS